MALWQRIAKLSRIHGESVGLWLEHKLDSTGSEMLPLEQGAQCEHFRFYWTEDAELTSSVNGSGQNSISHHFEPIVINSVTLTPFDQVQALANTLECCWEMLFTGPPSDRRKTGGYGFRPITSVISRAPEGRIPVFIFEVPFTGKAAPESWLQFDRSVMDDVDPTFKSKDRAVLIHSAPMHEMFHFVKMECMGLAEGWVSWILEGLPRWSQEMWHGYRSGIMFVGHLFDAWTGKGSILGDDSTVHLRSGYEFHEFWDYVGRWMSNLPYGARIRTPLCSELDARKDVCVGADVIRDFLEEWDRIPGPVTNAERAIQALTNVGTTREKSISADELEWGFLSQDWLGEDVIASRVDGQDRLQLFCKQYPVRTGQAQYVNALEMPSVLTSTFIQGMPLSWTSIGGQVTSAPAVIDYNNYGRNQIHVFARGTNGKICTNIKMEDNWTGWHSLSPQLEDSNITSAPVTVVVKKFLPNLIQDKVDHGGIHVFARGKGGLPWTAHFNGIQWWGGRTLSGILMRGHPAAAVLPIRVRPPGRPGELWSWALYLFVWANDCTLKYAKYVALPNDRNRHRWTNWQTLGSLEYTSSPACALLRNGNQHELVVVIRDDNNNLRAFIRETSGQWAAAPDGDNIGGSLRSGPGVGIIQNAAQQTLHVFARRDVSGGIVQCTRQGGTWSGWTNVQ
jgi:hypothetical protein